jgi:glycosyltransferase involved in cell wall biosynthesis
MLLYVANEIGGNNGNNAANFHALTSLLLTKEDIGVFSFTKIQFPNSIEGKKIPPLKLSLEIKNFPLTEEEETEVLNRLNQFNIKLIVVNDWAFYNFFKYKIFDKLNQSPRIRTALYTQTKPESYKFPYPFDEILRRTNEYDHFISASKLVINEWKKHGLRTKSSNIHCVQNCCDEQKTDSILNFEKDHLRKKLKIPRDRFISVCIASLQERKNQKIIIDNVSELINGEQDDLFIFVGGIVEEYDGHQILNKILSSSHNSNFLVIGEVDDALPYIRASDLLILPSHGEVSPVSILEAMALKTAVLASKTGGVPELIEHNRNGFCFDPQKPPEFIELYRQLRNESSLRSKFIDASFKKYKDKFSQKDNENAWKKVFQTMKEREY